jgi:hypothetical protein
VPLADLHAPEPPDAMSSATNHKVCSAGLLSRDQLFVVIGRDDLDIPIRFSFRPRDSGSNLIGPSSRKIRRVTKDATEPVRM